MIIVFDLDAKLVTIYVIYTKYSQNYHVIVYIFCVFFVILHATNEI